jgi:PAS domain S-box-containing protein
MQVMHRRLDNLYQGTSTLEQPHPDLLPLALKELGTASEELQVAVETLHQQNEELSAARAVVEAERQRYHELFEFAPDGYLVTDALGTIREANRAAATLLNVEQRFLVGKPLAIFVAKEERQAFAGQLNCLQQEKQAQELAIRLCPRHNQPFDAAMTVAALSNGEGKPVTIRICVRDISNRQRASVAPERIESNPSLERPKHVYLKGETIPLKPEIWQVCEGIVKLSTISENGEEVIVGLAGPSMPFGADLTELHTYQATALSKVQLVSFSLTEIAASPSLAQTFLLKIKQRLRQTESLLAISGQRHVKDRLYNILQLLKQEIGQPVEQGVRLSVRFTHQDFADACSTTRVTITRLLGKLQAQGKITFDSKNHIICKE